MVDTIVPALQNVQMFNRCAPFKPFNSPWLRFNSSGYRFHLGLPGFQGKEKP